jgi:hypothetical protein
VRERSRREFGFTAGGIAHFPIVGVGDEYDAER